MAVPDLKPKVEVQFSGTTWTDVTQYVEAVSISAGRSNEFDEIEAGTATISFDNRDGRFTPGKASSPYYPNVRPRKRIRVTSSPDGGTTRYTTFNGWVERWPVDVDGDKVSTCQVPCFDPIGFLGRCKMRPMLHQGAIVRLGSDHFWPCNDHMGSTQLANLANPTYPAQVVTTTGPGGTFDIGQAALSVRGEGSIGGSVVNTIESGLTTNGVVTLVNTGLTRGTKFSFACLVEASAISATSDHYLLRIDYTDGTSDSVYLEHGTGTMKFALVDAPAVGGPAFTYGQPVAVQFDVDLVTPFMKYTISGQYGDITTAAFNPAPVTANTRTIASVRFGNSVSFGAPSGTTFAMSNVALALSNNFPTTSPVGPHQAAVRDAFASNMWTTDALQIILQSAGLTSTLFEGVNPITETQVGIPDWDDQTAALEMVQKYTRAADYLVMPMPQSVAGTVYDVSIWGRKSRVNRSAVLTMKASTGTHPEPGLQFLVDEDHILNSINLTTLVDTSHARDGASIAEFSELTGDYESFFVGLTDADGFANWQLHMRSQPVTRCDSVTLNVTAGGSGFTAIPTLSNGYLVVLDELPSAVAPYTTATFVVEKIDHSITVSGETEQWMTTLSLSPADPWGVWVLEDATHGFIDDANSVIFY